MKKRFLILSVVMIAGTALGGCAGKTTAAGVQTSWKDNYMSCVNDSLSEETGEGYFLADLGGESYPSLVIQMKDGDKMPDYKIINASGDVALLNHGNMKDYDEAKLLGVEDGCLKVEYTKEDTPGSSDVVTYFFEDGSLGIDGQHENGSTSVDQEAVTALSSADFEKVLTLAMK